MSHKDIASIRVASDQHSMFLAMTESRDQLKSVPGITWSQGGCWISQQKDLTKEHLIPFTPFPSPRAYTEKGRFWGVHIMKDMDL